MPIHANALSKQLRLGFPIILTSMRSQLPQCILRKSFISMLTLRQQLLTLRLSSKHQRLQLQPSSDIREEMNFILRTRVIVSKKSLQHGYLTSFMKRITTIMNKLLPVVLFRHLLQFTVLRLPLL